MKLIRRWLDRISFVGVTSGVFAWGFVQGNVALGGTIRFEFAFVVLAVVLLQAVISSLIFTGFIGVSGVTFLWSLLRDTDPEPVYAGDTVTAIVPVYRDATVLDRSVESLLASEYEDLEVLIVTEEDDERSRERARELATREGVAALVNTRYPGSKAGAVSYAVEETDSEYVAVFDADEVVDPQFLPEAVARLRDCDVVQGRTVPQPDGLVEELAYYESVLLSYVGRRLLYVFTEFRMAASRAVVMRRSSLSITGGYDTEMLTEDFDFAYTCYKKHLDVEEQLGHPSRIESAHSLRDWWGQRKRWMTGYVQVLHKLVANARPIRKLRNLTSAAICAGTVVGSFLLLTILSKFVVLFLVGMEAYFLPPLVAVIGVTAAVRFHDWRVGSVDRLGWAWLVVPVIVPLYSLTAIKAVIEYAYGWDGDWYSVEKGS
ncbi:glycosyltransferase [Halorientalis regularis]|uniref:Glycosyltransferase, catalytic subunit of cellulose synthase and poly-beta-1,6-N-acetylglucosamine synthase n=1 Tax=Halorientalis regularis TaxID=660518 RepID=A0A1G7FY37_9EURY|nr:glycosyltransferase [Halorientalis regularis]SDE80722.1 Glycosyltransferase, catalytic subunit of cellulose synthase and poly-beta-1,6-N-acetylglucosamine synthase [Halorientalis regularis]